VRVLSSPPNTQRDPADGLQLVRLDCCRRSLRFRKPVFVFAPSLSITFQVNDRQHKSCRFLVSSDLAYALITKIVRESKIRSIPAPRVRSTIWCFSRNCSFRQNVATAAADLPKASRQEVRNFWASIEHLRTCIAFRLTSGHVSATLRSASK
jgi:hypothetical protein